MQYVFYAMPGYGVTMVLRCSLLGHDYGETEVEREREERGSEVVVTVREYEACTRCGNETVISENTEVTSLTTETDDTPPTDPNAESEPDAETTETEFIDADGDEDTPTDEAEVQPAAPTDAGEASAAASDTEFSVPTDENGEPVTDDGEILDDETEPEPPRDDRGHGEWPDSDDVGPPVGAENEPKRWSDDDTEQTAGDGATESTADDADSEPTAGDDDAVVLESGTDDGDSIGLDASPPDADAIDADPDSEAEPDPGTGIKRARSAPAPTDARTDPGKDEGTELYCPSCESVSGSDRSSLRPGDICPECRKGYLSERSR